MAGLKAPERPAGESVAEQLDGLFAPWARTDAPGLVVAAALKGRVIYRRGFGMASLESAVANTPATRMRIGSTSKHFTCLLALLLAEDGALDLDKPIRTYIPELTGPGGDPTLRQLLQHRGGSRCYLDLGFIGHGFAVPRPGEALAAQVRQTGRNFAPGEAMIYNNGGYHLVSIAIERAGGAPFEAQLNDRLFAPVGMTATASIPSDFQITPGVAAMHIPSPGGGWRRGLFPSEEVRGEGAIVSTVDDMLRWMVHLRTRDRFGAPSTWGQLLERPVYADGSTGVYALGLMIGEYRGLKVVHHAGGVIGGSSQMLTLPDAGLDIIIMVNGAKRADPVRLAEQVVDVVLADQVGPEAPKASASQHQRLLGDWWSPETGMIYTLCDEDGALKLRVGAPMGLDLRPGEAGRLVLPAGSIGQIEIDPAGLDEGEALPIRFGGHTHRYRRLPAEVADADAFAEAALGDYRSSDADAGASIRRNGDELILSLHDSVGRIDTRLHAKTADVAATTPVSPLDIAYWAISLTGPPGRAAGFRLNTVRTRNLEFHRVAPAP